MSFFLPKHFFFWRFFYLLNGNQYRKNVTNALPDPSRGQTRVSISSITPTAMQGPRDKACPLGDFHGIHSSTERQAWGKTSQSARCEALGQCTKLTPPLLLLRFHSLKPVFTEHLRGAGQIGRGGVPPLPHTSPVTLADTYASVGLGLLVYWEA